MADIVESLIGAITQTDFCKDKDAKSAKEFVSRSGIEFLHKIKILKLNS